MPAPLGAAVAAVGAAAGQPASPHGYGMALLSAGAVHACNGALYARMSAPLPPALPPTLVPYAMLLAAAHALPEGAALRMARTATHLQVGGGSFNARLPALPGEQCAWLPTIDAPQYLMPPGMERALQIAARFMGDSSGPQWMAGVRLQGGYCIATDGIAAARAHAWEPLEMLVPDCTLPALAVREIVRRMPSQPDHAIGFCITATQATLHFMDGFVLRTSLIDGLWPRAPDSLFAQCDATKAKPIPETLAAAVRAVAPFALPETRPLIHLAARGAVVAAMANAGDEEAATVDGFPTGTLSGTYRAETLGRVLEIATSANWDSNPATWAAPGVVGLIVGTKG